ncbi:MAG: flagellar motor switch protein FliN [Spirochaetales bacterium]|nr:flagellar motor switch protein FliN [Spirochaetales bacterium]
MSDGSLSQDEIDALLQGGGTGMAGMSASTPAGSEKTGPFSKIVNGITGQMSSNLTNLVGKNVQIGRPVVEATDRDGILGSLPDEVVEIKLDFTDGVQGDHSFIFPTQLATAVAGLMMGQEGVELNEAALSALEEAGNTMAGNSATVFGDKIGATVMTSPGKTKKALKASLKLPSGGFMKVSYPVTIEGEAPAEIYEVFSMPVVDTLIGNGGGMDLGIGAGQAVQSQSMGMGMSMGGMNMGPANVQSVQFPNLMPQSSTGDQGNIGLLMDVYMEMTVELGRTKRLIRDILGMGEGTIIELDKLAGEPVDILVNHKPIAKGEVVVIDENFGVRVTEIISPVNRVGDL